MKKNIIYKINKNQLFELKLKTLIRNKHILNKNFKRNIIKINHWNYKITVDLFAGRFNSKLLLTLLLQPAYKFYKQPYI